MPDRTATVMHTTAEIDALLAAKPRRDRTSHQGRKLRYEGTRMACPMCDAQSEIRTSWLVSKTMRETAYQCTNVECGATFVVGSEILRMLNLGGVPNLKVNIPISSHVRREVMRVVLDNAGVAQHQARFTQPETGDLFASSDNPTDTT